MAEPDGPLTPAQYEILEAIWETAENGATVSEVWHAIGQKRRIARTTVLNQVDRLERRGWLRRKKRPDGFRYLATKSRAQVTRGLIDQFVDSFFAGSASDLVMNLFGSKKLKKVDIASLRRLLDDRLASKKDES